MDDVIPPILPRKGAGAVPASVNQERAFRVEREAGTAQLAVSFTIHVTGDCNDEVLRQAVHRVVQRHEVLRTYFAVEHGAVFQHVQDVVEIPWECTYAQDINVTDGAWAAGRLLHFAETSVDLSKAPLMRVAELVCSASDRKLIFWLHHLIGDGWSVILFIGELSIAYEDIMSGRASALDRPPLQYNDFTLWQHDLLAAPLGRRAETFWKSYLEACPALGEYKPPDPRRSHVPAKTLTWELDPQALADVRDFAQTHGVRPLSVLLAAHALAAILRGRTDDAFVSMPLLNRRATGSREIFGWIASTLLLALPTSGVVSAYDVVMRTHETYSKTAEYDFVPMGSILKFMGAGGDLRQQAARVYFNFNPTRRTDYQGGGLTFELSTTEAPTILGFYDYGVSIYDVESGVKAGIYLCIGYHLDAFSDDDAREIARHFLHALGEILRRPFDDIAQCKMRLAEPPHATGAREVAWPGS